MKRVLILLSFLFFTLSCESLSPVYNVKGEEFITGSGKRLSSEEIKTSIIRAGIRLGWKIESIENGKMIGSLTLREHIAKIEINYTDNFYNIKYIDSSNLNYDGNNIHKNYNKWIYNLERNINTEIIKF